MKKIFLLVLTIVALGSSMRAETYNLTLQESIEVAKQKSYSMKQLEQSLKIAEHNLNSTTSRLKTHITLNLTTPNYQEIVREKADSSGVFFAVKQLSYSGNVSVNQPLPTDGEIYVRTGLSTLKDYYDNFRSSNLNTIIGFRQPLDIFYGYSQIKTDLKNARLSYESAQKSYKREELDLIYQVSASYYNLLSLQKQTEIALSNLERQTEAFEISKNKYEAGLIREVDALQMEVDLAAAQSDYDLAYFNQHASINSFKEIIGIDLTDDVILSSQLDYKVVLVNPEDAVEKALKNRIELREYDIQIELNKLSIKRQKVMGLPRGTIDASYERIGLAMSRNDFDVPNSVRNSYNNLWDRGPAFRVGFSVSIPILDFGENRSYVRAAEARLKNTEYIKEDRTREIEVSVRNLAAGINTNLKRLQMLEKNVSVAEKSFDITLQRYSDGDIDSQALALERNRLNSAYVSHLGAYIQYQLSLVQLTRDTLYDFIRDVSAE